MAIEQRGGATAGGSLVLFGLLAGFVCFLGMLSPAGATALLLVIAAYEVSPRPKSFLPTRGTPLVFVSSLVLLLAWWDASLGRDLVESAFLCGTGPAAMLIMLPPIAAVVGAMSFGIVQALARWAPRLVERLVWLMALTATLAAVALGPVALFRALTRPSARAYLARLPEVARLAAPSLRQMACKAPTGPPDPERVDCEDRHRFGDHVVVRHVSSLAPGAHHAVSVRPAHAVETPETPIGFARTTFAMGASLVVRRDARFGYFLVQSDDDVAAFDAASGGPINVSPRTLVPVTAPHWIVAVFAVLSLSIAAGAVWVVAWKRRGDVRFASVVALSVTAALTVVVAGLRLGTPFPAGFLERLVRLIL